MPASSKLVRLFVLLAPVIGGAALLAIPAAGVGSGTSTPTTTPTTSAQDESTDAAGISISKKVKNGPFREGDHVSFHVTVKNTGSAALSGVSVTDRFAPDCAREFDETLEPNGTWGYDCGGDAPKDDVTTTARVSGRTDSGQRVTGEDSAKVDVIHPAIAIRQSLPSPMARAGDPVTFTITVANTGDSPLRDVKVSYPATRSCDKTLGVLAAKTQQRYTCTMVAGTDDFTGTARANGTDQTSHSVTSEDDAAIDVIHPSLKVTETGPAKPVVPGRFASFTVRAENTGDVPLTGVLLASQGCASAVGKLDVGEVAKDVTCKVPVGQQDLDHVVEITGTDPMGLPVTGKATATAIAAKPGIAVGTESAAQTTQPGSPVTFTLTVTNLGNVDLAPVKVHDDGLPLCDKTFDRLAAGQRQSWTCTVTAPDTGELTSAPVGVGTPDTEQPGDDVTASATVKVGVAAPSTPPEVGQATPPKPPTGTGAVGSIGTSGSLVVPRAPVVAAPAVDTLPDAKNDDPLQVVNAKSLAGTGVNAWLPGLLGFLMLLVGGGLVLSGRKLLRR